MRPIHIVISCEHAGNKIPVEYAKYFDKAYDILRTHRGWDIGGLRIAEYMSENLHTPLLSTNVSRMVVDCNRSLSNEGLFSIFTDKLGADIQQQILNKYYHPYRHRVTKAIEDILRKGPVLHLSVHTFTPVMKGVERKVDIGLLFDRARTQERRLCEQWLSLLNDNLEGRSMLNQPYHGEDDGFTTHLRTKFDAYEYLGIELEINQKWVGHPFMNDIKHALTNTLRPALLSIGYESNSNGTSHLVT